MSPGSLLAALGAGSLRLLLDLWLVGAPLVVGVVGFLRISRAGHPRVRYGIALLAFAAAVAIPVGLALPPSAERAAASPAGPAAARPTGATAAGSLPAAAATLSAAQPIAPACFLLWLVVAAVLVGRELAGHRELARSRRGWCRADAALLGKLDWPATVPLFLAERDGPSAVGIVRSAVVIPRALSDALGLESARHVTWHELSHARWRDPAINVAVRLLRAVLWPSLPLWALERALRLEREAAADWAAVTREARTPSPAVLEEYASALIAVARWFEAARGSATSVLVATPAGSALGERVARLLSPRGYSPGRVAFAGGVLLAGAWAAVAVPAAPQVITPSVVTDTVRIDNPPDAPVVITSAELPGSSAGQRAAPLSPLPAFTLRNASRVPVFRIVIGVWNAGVLDARLLYREPLPPGSQITIDPAKGSPNVFAAAVARPLLRVLAVEFSDGRRWTHPGAPPRRD